MTTVLNYAELADQLGEVAAATDIDIYGHQVVVYRAHGTIAPFKATILSEHNSDNPGFNTYETSMELARHLTNLDDAAIVQPDLPSLRDACAAQGLAFPIALIPVASLIEREKGRRGQHSIRMTEANNYGMKTLLVEADEAVMGDVFAAVDRVLSPA